MNVGDEELTSLLNLGRGGAIERFDEELRRVVENVLDVNTTDAARTITLSVKLKPNKDRTRCAVSVSCSSKVCPSEPFDTVLFVGRDGRGPVAMEHNPEQLNIFTAPVKLSEVARG